MSIMTRIVTALFGVLFVVLAIVIMVVTGPPWDVGAVIGGLVVGGLGVDAVVSAARDRPSLLSRIGPLP